ncbi:MAG: hypothetical protein JWM59_3779 [Verrucomicrobiales bacterium]|nr:hypothetical protein [Verrucomicrobiales bacterium]
MNSNTVESAVCRLCLKLESAPAFGSGTMPADQERAFVMLAHLFPLIIWFWKRRESPAVDAHGKEALNFGITAMICIWPVSLIAGFLPSIITVIISLGLAVVSFGVLALVIYGMIQARSGQLLRYPVNFRLIK